MTREEFEKAVIAALGTKLGVLDGVSYEDAEAHTQWNKLGRAGKVILAGVQRRVYWQSNGDGAGHLRVSLPKTRRVDPLAGLDGLLTTPEEDFGSVRGGSSGNEPA